MVNYIIYGSYLITANCNEEYDLYCIVVGFFFGNRELGSNFLCSGQRVCCKVDVNRDIC